MKQPIIRCIFILAYFISCLFCKRGIQTYLNKRFPYIVTRRELAGFAVKNLIPPNWNSNNLNNIYYSLPATREEAAYIVSHAVSLRYTNRSHNNGQTQRFLDENKISPYAGNAVRQISVIGAVGGDSGKFLPRRMIHREILQDWLEKLDDYKQKMPVISIGRLNNIPVLMYHSISNKPYGGNLSESWLFTRPSDFEWQIRYLTENGYTFLFADEFDYANSFSKPIIITMDDGYSDNYKNAFPIISKYCAKMTIFVTSAFVGNNSYLSKNHVKELSRSNYASIQSHTVNHLKLAQYSGDKVEIELQKSKEELEAIIGRPVKCIAYPHGSFNNNVISHAAKYYDYGYAIGNGSCIPDLNPYKIKRLEIPRSINFDTFVKLIRM